MIDIEIEHLSASYNGTTAVEDLVMTVSGGSWVALIGPNGAGKTTVLRVVTGSLAFDGEVTIGSTSVKETTRRELARMVAYVPQRPYMPLGATVTDYVLMGRNPYIGYFSMESRADLAVVGEVVDRLELGRFAQREVTSLSGGEAQRVVLARALAQKAPVLLLDEPTSELDVGHQQQALELVDELRVEVGLTVLSTMHDLTLAGQYAQGLVLLDEGRTVARGGAEEVLKEDLIRRYYGASVEVLRDPAGLVVVPRRPSHRQVPP